MAQLPPKAPSMVSRTAIAPPWGDVDFLEFSSERRGAHSHRRSSSDSMAFLDDDLLVSIFSDDTSSPPPPPSDHNDVDGLFLNPKPEPPEAHSADNSPGDDAGDLSPGYHDPKRVKRIIANRQSAQRSRVRKLQYISELERSVTALQTEVSVLSPRVAYLDHQRLILNVDNSTLKQRIAALSQDRIFKDAHQEALKREIERLRQVAYDQQQNSKCGNQVERPQFSSAQANSDHDHMEY